LAAFFGPHSGSGFGKKTETFDFFISIGYSKSGSYKIFLLRATQDGLNS
jgi:hypothetical protein